MKTLQELYNEIVASDEQKKAFVEAMKAGKLEDFLKAHGCEAAVEEVREYIEAKAAEKGSPIYFAEDDATPFLPLRLVVFQDHAKAIDTQ